MVVLLSLTLIIAGVTATTPVSPAPQVGTATSQSPLPSVVFTTTAPAATSSSGVSEGSTIPLLTRNPGINETLWRKCGNANDTEYCHYEGTNEICDICKGVRCESGKKCEKQEMVCAPVCVCANPVDVMSLDGVCRNPCDLQPCQNNGICTADITAASKYRCNCTKEFEGENCEKYHNFCLDPAPSFCPTGEYTCEMYGFRNYSCKCAEGFYFNVTSNQCVKVGQQVSITLFFKDTPYSEIYNNITHPEAISARRTIQAVFDKIYGINLIKLVFNNFTQGSLVAHLELMLKLHDSGTFRNNEKIFKQFLLECDTTNQECFGTLGKAFLPYDGWVAKDERCGNVICPEYTFCRPIDGQPLRTECVCERGFDVLGANADDQGRVIQICRDIDECATHPCETEEECINTPGSFICGGVPDNANCPEGSQIVVTGPFSYRCECSWIYGGTECRFPLTLILLILACIFLITTIAAILYSVFRKRQDRTGTYQLYAVPDGMSSTKTVQSSWT